MIYFQAIMIVFMIFQLLKRIFFGELRAAETEVGHFHTVHLKMIAASVGKSLACRRRNVSCFYCV